MPNSNIIDPPDFDYLLGLAHFLDVTASSKSLQEAVLGCAEAFEHGFTDTRIPDSYVSCEQLADIVNAAGLESLIRFLIKVNPGGVKDIIVKCDPNYMPPLCVVDGVPPSVPLAPSNKPNPVFIEIIGLR